MIMHIKDNKFGNRTYNNNNFILSKYGIHNNFSKM